MCDGGLASGNPQSVPPANLDSRESDTSFLFSFYDTATVVIKRCLSLYSSNIRIARMVVKLKCVKVNKIT